MNVICITRGAQRSIHPFVKKIAYLYKHSSFKNCFFILGLKINNAYLILLFLCAIKSQQGILFLVEKVHLICYLNFRAKAKKKYIINRDLGLISSLGRPLVCMLTSELGCCRIATSL